MAKHKCPKGMGRNITEQAHKAHPDWNPRQIAEAYPLSESTAWRYLNEMKQERNKEMLRESLQKAINSHAEPTRDELKSNRWLLFAGVMAGIALMLMFVLFERGIH